jgi:hypothetical protein
MKAGLVALRGSSLWHAQIYRCGIEVMQYDGLATFSAEKFPARPDSVAAALGYTDFLQFNIEHDLASAILAEQIYGRPSASLWWRAHDPLWPYHEGSPPAHVLAEYDLVDAALGAMNGIQEGRNALQALTADAPRTAQDYVNVLYRLLRPDDEVFNDRHLSALPTLAMVPHGASL